MESNDPTEVESARDGLNQIVEMTYGDTFKLAHKLTGNEDDAHDVVQDAYLRMQRGMKKFRGDAKFTTWLYRITANAASNHRAKKARHNHVGYEEMSDEQLSMDDSVHEAFEARQMKERVLKAMQYLSPKLRTVVELRFVHDLSHSAIAKRLGISESAAKVRLHRARQKMAEETNQTPRAASDRTGEVLKSDSD